MGEEMMVPTKVSIELSLLNKNKLTADLYILLHWGYHKNYALSALMVETLLDDDFALNYLEEEGFIKITGDKEFKLRQQAINLFETSTPEQKWLEFLGKYPVKVPNGKGGTRTLKISNPDSPGNTKLRKKYINIIKDSPELHQQIIQVLEAEIEMRKNSGDLQFMQGMEPWLNQASYDKYLHLIEEDKTEKSQSDYGQSMV